MSAGSGHKHKGKSQQHPTVIDLCDDDDDDDIDDDDIWEDNSVKGLRAKIDEQKLIIEVRDKTLKNIAASLQAERVDLIEEKINDMKDKVAWINDYKEAFNELGMLLGLDPIYDDDGNPSYIPRNIITAVEKLLEAKASQPSSSGMSSQMFKL